LAFQAIFGVVSALASAGSAVSGMAAASRRASAQKKAYQYEVEAFYRNADQAIESLKGQYKAIGRRRQELHAQASEAKLARTIQAMKAKSRANVQAAEGGIKGTSLSHRALLADVQRQLSTANVNAATNLKAQQDQLTSQAEGIQAQTQDIINRNQPGPAPVVEGPDVWGGIASLAGGLSELAGAFRIPTAPPPVSGGGTGGSAGYAHHADMVTF